MLITMSAQNTTTHAHNLIGRKYCSKMDICSEPDIHGYHSQTIFYTGTRYHSLQVALLAIWSLCSLKKWTKLVGKSAEALHKQYDPNDTPTEISDLVGHKFTFIVRVLPNKSIWSDNPSFEVIRIKERFGKQPTNPSLRRHQLDQNHYLIEWRKFTPTNTYNFCRHIPGTFVASHITAIFPESMLYFYIDMTSM
jgi:hypothetical protein